MDALRLSFSGPSRYPRDCGTQLIDRYKEGPRPREDQILGTGPVGELAGDGLPHPVAHGYHPDTGQTFRFGLEAAAEPASLRAHLDDRDAAQLGEDSAAALVQQLAAAQPGPELDEKWSR